MRDAKDLKFFICKSDTTEHQPIAAKSLDGVDTHTAHQLLDFVLPSVHQVDESLITEIGIETLDKLGTLCCNTPVTLAGLASTAEMTAEGEQSRSSNIAGIRTKCNCLYHVCGRTDTTTYHKGYVISDAFIAQTLINRSKSKLNRNTYVIADSRRSRTRTAAESVNSNDIRTASCNSAGNSGNVVDCRNLDGRAHV